MVQNSDKILLCSDLDRTIIPNGHAAESPDARTLLHRVARRPELMLVYVTGRDEALITQALREWNLPLPKIAVGDVGTAIFDVSGTAADPVFTPWKGWQEIISADWQGKKNPDMLTMLADFDVLRIQEPEKQKDFKLSFYVDSGVDMGELAANIHRHLERRGIRASVITSMDEMAGVGLVDIVPAGATKVDAISHIAGKYGLDKSRVIFAGDSGNDLPALTSGFNAVLVKNASDEVRSQAVAESSRKKTDDRLYLAKGEFLGMNGNYAAGVLEGLAHFMPETRHWLRQPGPQG